jgi:hypothetical protein
LTWFIHKTITVPGHYRSRVCRSLPADATVECDVFPTAPTATNNCGTAAVTYAEVRTDGTWRSNSLARTWTATDGVD